MISQSSCYDVITSVNKCVIYNKCENDNFKNLQISTLIDTKRDNWFSFQSLHFKVEQAVIIETEFKYLRIFENLLTVQKVSIVFD